MADSIVELCENMSLTEGEQVGLCIHEDDTADLRMMWGKCLVGRLLTERRVQKDAFCWELCSKRKLRTRTQQAKLNDLVLLTITLA